MAIPGISSSRQLPLAGLVPGPNPWRGKADVRDLTESLDRSPLLHPLVVRAVPGRRNRWEIVSGHRRYEAARKLGHSHLECRIVDVDDLQAEVLSLTENLKRQDLKNNKAAVARLMALYEAQSPTKRGRPTKRGHGDTISAARRVARVTGLSPREVRRLAKVGGHPEALAAYDAGQLTLTQAEKLATHGQLELLKLPKQDDTGRGLAALRAAVKYLGATRPTGRHRKEALTLLGALERILR